MGMQRGKQVLYFRLLTEKGQGFGEEKKELQQGSKNKLCFFDEHVVKISIDDGEGGREGGSFSKMRNQLCMQVARESFVFQMSTKS